MRKGQNGGTNNTRRSTFKLKGVGVETELVGDTITGKWGETV